eukprot:TRINITY_DN2079_c0_g1_i4.p1 TRINITY_DN2079_c0_g1~~TRINITY_DN2079_c0_g1_i4.p1  ORF type:complete len:191 (-),score=76.09 TRINITY_DN2079_c0_g1_i4:2-574(-)
MVEFAKDKNDTGLSHIDAILAACRMRLRPILMTSIAFTAGVIPLVLATGAGAEMRHAMGNAVFSGMIGVTVFGLLFTPVFYMLVVKKKVTHRSYQMTNQIAKRFKTQLTVASVLMVTLTSGCASKVDVLDEQKTVNEFVASAAVADQLSGADETNWWHALKSEQLNQLVSAHVLCVDTGRSSETAKAHRG